MVLLSILVLPIFSLYSEEAAAERWLWPIAAGTESIAMRPGIYQNEKYNCIFYNEGYFLTAAAGTEVYAPFDGVIDFIVPYNLDFPDGQGGYSYDSLEGFLNSQTEKAGSLFVRENLSASIRLRSVDGKTRLYISGLEDLQLPGNTEVKRGQVIGKVGYNRVFLDKPSIKLTGNTDIGPLLVGESNREFFDYYANLYRLYNPHEELAKEEALATWTVFSRTLLEDHPALLDITKYEQVSSFVMHVEQDMPSTITNHDLVRLMRQAIALLNCSHTRLGLLNRNYRRPVLPLLLTLHEDRCFEVWDRRADGTLAAGTEVVAIQGLTIEQLIKQISSIVSIDSANPQTKLDFISGGFESYVAMLLPPAASYSFTVKDTEGVLTVLDLPPLSADRSSFPDSWPASALEEKPELEYVNIDTALFRLSDLSRLSEQPKYNELFEDLEAAGIKNLILDLRGNGGGAPENTAFMLGFFSDQQFRMEEYVEFRKSGGSYSSAYALGVWQGSGSGNYIEYSGLQESDTGRFIRPGIVYTRQANQALFEGQLYVLVDSATISAGVVLASRLQAIGAITIGEETSGGRDACNAAQTQVIKLGDSGITLYLPLFRAVFTDDESNAFSYKGLIPIYERSRTLEDKIFGTDSILDFTLDLIANPPPEPEPVLAVQDNKLYVFAGIGVVLVIALAVLIVLAKKRKPAPAK